MRHILILFFCLFIGSLYGQIVRVDSTVIYESRSIYNQAGYLIGKDSFHVKQVRLAYCNDTFYERNDTLIARYPQRFITTDSLGAYATKSQVRDSIGTIDSDHDGVADDADLLDGQNGSYYLNRANHYGNQDTLTITGLGEFTEDRIGSKVVAGTGISKSYNDTTGELTISSTVTGDVTGVSVTGYLTGGGTSGDVTIGVDTVGNVGLATKYDIAGLAGGGGDITDVNVTNYLTGGGTTGSVTIGVDTSSSAALATKYYVAQNDKIYDPDTLSIVGSTLSISGGNSVTIPSGESTTVADSPTIDLTLSGSQISGIVILNSIDSTHLKANSVKGSELEDVGTAGTYNNVTTDVNGRVTSGSNVAYLTAEVDGSTTNEIELPSQTGNNGKYLTTNGTSPSWATVPDGDITAVTASDYLTGGGTTGSVTIGIDTTGSVGVATKYDVGTKIDGIGSVHYVPKFSDSNTLTDSRIYDDGDNNIIQIGNGTTSVVIDYVDGKAVNIANNGAYHTTIKGVSTGITQNGTIITHNIDDEMGLIGGSYDGYYIDLGGSGYSTISTATEGVFINKINTSSTESNLFTVKNDGKVGIGGVTEPSATLHVDGTLKVTSQTGTPTKILGVDASGNVGEVGKGFGISVSSGNILVDTTKIVTQFDISGMGDVTGVTVSDYLTGGGTSGAVSIGMDTTGTVGVATKYDLKDLQTGTQVRDSIGTIDANHDGKADDATKFEGQGGGYYLSRANHTGTQDTSTIAGLGEFVEDRAGAKIVAGTNITTSYNDATGEVTINATGGSGGGLTAEEVRDTVVNMFKKVGPSITFNETDSADSIFLDVNFDPFESMVQRSLIGRNIQFAISGIGNTNLQVFGTTVAATGTANQPLIGTTNDYEKRVKTEFQVTTASTTAVGGLRVTPSLMSVEGFIHSVKWGISIGTSNTSKRAFAGIRNSTNAPTDVSPNTLVSCFGIGYDDALDSNLKIYHNDGSGTCTEIDLGSNFPIPTADRTNYYTLIIYVPTGGSTWYYKVVDEVNGNSTTGNVTSNLPTSTTILGPFNYSSVGGANATTGIAIFSMYSELYDDF